MSPNKLIDNKLWTKSNVSLKIQTSGLCCHQILYNADINHVNYYVATTDASTSADVNNNNNINNNNTCL